MVANAAIVPAGTSGAVSVYVSDATDVIIDINGYFAPPGGSGRAVVLHRHAVPRGGHARQRVHRGFRPAQHGRQCDPHASRFPQSSCGVPVRRAGLLAEHDGGAAGPVDLPDHVAGRAVAAGGFHAE